MSGAEPIIYRLATVGGLPLRTAQAPVPMPGGVQAAPAEKAPPAATTLPEPRPEPVEPPRRTRASPSFNCNLARTRSERMVCSSPRLAAKDRQMSSMFYSALADANGRTRGRLRSSRDRFLAFRERCGNEACVAQAYDDRMDEIRDIMAGR